MSRGTAVAVGRVAALTALCLASLAGCQAGQGQAGQAGRAGASDASDTSDATAASTSSAAAPVPGTRVDLAVRDFALRPLTSTCAGARPFLDLRPGATVVVTDAAGAERATGRLPEGAAIKATDIDFEGAPREPTYCLFAVEVSPALAAGTYTLTAGDGRVMRLNVDPGADVSLASFPSVGTPEDVLGPSPTASVTP